MWDQYASEYGSKLPQTMDFYISGANILSESISLYDEHVNCRSNSTKIYAFIEANFPVISVNYVFYVEM